MPHHTNILLPLASAPTAVLKISDFSGIAGGSAQVINSLFHRGEVGAQGGIVNSSLALSNNLFYQVPGIALTQPSGSVWHAFNNAFDRCTFTSTSLTNGFNAYILCNTNLSPTTTNNVVVTNFTYTSGLLGDFYHLSTNLLNKGSTSASLVGLYHYTTQTNQFKEANSIVDIGYHYVVVDESGNPMDTDQDGLADWEEELLGTLFDNADSDYDGQSDFYEWMNGTDPNDATSAVWSRMGYWRFNTEELIGEEGQEPTLRENTTTPSSWSATAVFMNDNSELRYREIEPYGQPNINCRNGTIRFWYKPHWTSVSLGGEGPSGNTSRLVELGEYGGTWWCLYLSSTGNEAAFGAKSNGVSITYFSFPVQFVSNRWCQLALTYSPTNIACYTNGLLAATAVGRPVLSTGEYVNQAGFGIHTFPPPEVRAGGFRLGNDHHHVQPALGEFEEFETFNYPLTAQQIARDFPNFNGCPDDPKADSDYDGRSDLLEVHADGTDPEDSDQAMPTRLGYWRFNDAAYTGEMGQVPLAEVDAFQTPSWSSSAVTITSDTASRVTYRDVETNGWANVNCRQGAVRFWFKPNWNSGSRVGSDLPPFVYLGDNVSSCWQLYMNEAGSIIAFLSLSNNFPGGFLPAALRANSNEWCQIVLNYSPTTLTLYTNGTIAADADWGISAWPDASVRSNGLTFGNCFAGGRPLDVQFEEIQTFNYCLTSEEIERNFKAVKSVDSNLNGVADVVEELTLAASSPFTGAPFPVTGVFEAEQFDLGGPDVGYHALDTANATADYRTSRLWITNCDDLGGGYCVNRLRAGEWLKYTMDVRVGQTYAVECRVAGLGTNGVFTIEFATNGTTYAFTTNHLRIGSTNWSNVTFKNLWLTPGTNVMKVTMLTNGLVNGSDSGGVARLNYISTYPSWNEGVTNLVATNYVTGLVSNLCDWVTASNNTVAIQNAIDSLDPNQGGLVVIPEGRFFVASRKITDETLYEQYNNALFIYANNIMVQGAGKTSTTLVAHNRAVNILYVGRQFAPPSSFPKSSVTNFTLADLSLEGSPHWVYDPAATNQRTWEEGAFWPNPPPAGGWRNTGCLLVAEGNNSPISWLDNLLATNCLFKNSPLDDIVLPGYVTRFLSVSNDFLFRADGTNGGYTGQVTDPTRPTTVSYPSYPRGTWGVGLYVRTYGPSHNILVTDCTFDGHVNSTNVDSSRSACGIIWCQSWGGNWLAARNTVTNYVLEALQFNSGPATAVQNRFVTGRTTGATCALCPAVYSTAGPTGQRGDLGFSFVGNTVTGGRQGVFGRFHSPSELTYQASLLVSGNVVALDPPLPIADDSPGAALNLWWTDRAVLSGNTLSQGGMGLSVGKVCTNALVLKNDFGSSSRMGIDDGGVGLLSATIARNKLGAGTSFHLRAPMSEGVHHFLIQNTYVNTNGISMNPFLEPLALPVHHQP